MPVDSEHSAIFQAMRPGRPGGSQRIVLTASGGPFRRAQPAQLANVTPQDALRHPTWTMGSKNHGRFGHHDEQGTGNHRSPQIDSAVGSMISSALFIMVAESTVIFRPMVQVGWRRASCGVTLANWARLWAVKGARRWP